MNLHVRVNKLSHVILNRQVNIPVKNKLGLLVLRSKGKWIEEAVKKCYGDNGWEKTIIINKND